MKILYSMESRRQKMLLVPDRCSGISRYEQWARLQLLLLLQAELPLLEML
jgi:hypothetical protein